MAAAKKAKTSEWNSWITIPQDKSRIILNVDGKETECDFFEYEDSYDVVDLDSGIVSQVNAGSKSLWKLKPAEPVTVETKSNENKRLDTKIIPDDLARRWIAEKMLEEFGTVANDLQLNTDKLIAYYNAGMVKK